VMPENRNCRNSASMVAPCPLTGRCHVVSSVIYRALSRSGD
jgi:hypothetical protein